MGATSFGGIRAGGSARFGAGFGAGVGFPASQAAAMPQPGSPYTAAAPMRVVGSGSTANVVLALVALEVLALLALRHGFRYHHGG